MGLALSLAGDPMRVAAWIDGFLRGSGIILLHDKRLWGHLDRWVGGLSVDAFVCLLPLLRRTFSSFPEAERRQMGEQARAGVRSRPAAIVRSGIDPQRAESVVGIVATLLGLDIGETESEESRGRP